jgi:hypothetical protein
MTYAEAIEYLQPIADSSSLKRYSVALSKAIHAMQEMQKIEDMKPLVLNAKTAEEMRQMLQEVGKLKPTIFPAEPTILHCWECGHWNEEIGWCKIHSHFITSDGEACHPWESSEWKMFNAEDYCSSAERKVE